MKRNKRTPRAWTVIAAWVAFQLTARQHVQSHDPKPRAGKSSNLAKKWYLNRCTAEAAMLRPTGRTFDAAGQLSRRIDRNGRVIDYSRDDLLRQTGDTWYNNGIDADAQQNAAATITTR